MFERDVKQFELRMKANLSMLLHEATKRVLGHVSWPLRSIFSRRQTKPEKSLSVT